MTEIPNTVNGKIEYFEQHIPLWAADPAAIGLTANQIVDISALTGTARISYNSAQTARQASKSATFAQTGDVQSMVGLGSALIATIRAFADANNSQQAVFIAAGIDPINPASPTPPPVPATNVRASLLNSGEIRLDWDGTVANGTFYAVSRRLGEAEPFELIGSVSAKTFIDTTIPAATAEATYTLRTIRDTETSDDSEPITVRLGVGGVGVGGGAANTGGVGGVGGVGGESSGEDGSIGIAA